MIGGFAVLMMIDIPVIDRARRLIQRYDAIERRLKR